RHERIAESVADPSAAQPAELRRGWVARRADRPVCVRAYYGSCCGDGADGAVACDWELFLLEDSALAECTVPAEHPGATFKPVDAAEKRRKMAVLRGQCADGDAFLLAGIVQYLAVVVEDHGGARRRVVGGPVRQAGHVWVAGAGEGGPGGAHFCGERGCIRAGAVVACGFVGVVEDKA